MSWLFSRASVEASLPVRQKDGDASAQSRSTDMPQAYYSGVKMKGYSHLSRYGMTYAPLDQTTRSAADLSIIAAQSAASWSLPPAFHARISAGQEKEPASMAPGRAYFLKRLALLARYDQGTLSWKTPQLSLIEGSTSYSARWPSWGIMLHGACWELMTPALPTSAKDAGLWPTPTEAMSGEYSSIETFRARQAKQIKKRGRATIGPCLAMACKLAGEEHGHLNPPFVEWLMGFPIGWTELKDFQMLRYHEWQQWHGTY